MAGAASLLGIPVYLRDASLDDRAAHPSRRTDDLRATRREERHDIPRRLRGRAAQAGDRPPTRPRAQPAHPRQRRRAALRRRHVGRPGPSGARRLRRPARGAAAWWSTSSRPCSPRRSTARVPASSCRTQLTTATRFGPALDVPLDELVGSTPARSWPSLLIGGVLKSDVAKLLHAPSLLMEYLGAGRLPAATAPEPPVPARQLGLGLRRGVHQPDGQAGAAAGDHQLAPGLQLPPDVHARADVDLPLRQRRAGTRVGHASRAATSPCIGNRAVMIGMGERSTPQGVEMLSRSLFRAGARRHGDRRRAPSRTRVHAPGHGHDDDRPGRVLRLPLPPGRAPVVHAQPRSATAATSRSRRTPSCSRSSPRPSVSTTLRVLRTPIDKRGAEREQWDDGNNFLAVAPGVDPRLRAQHDHQPLPHRPGHPGRPGRGRGARPRPRRTALHDLSHRARRGVGMRADRPARPQLPQGARLHARRVALAARAVRPSSRRDKQRRHRDTSGSSARTSP